MFIFRVNLNVFDYMSHMVSDEVALNLRSAHGFDGLLNHLGEAGSNPVRDHGVLVLRFERHSQTVTYPTLPDFYRYSTEVLEKLDDQRHNVTFIREKRDINEDDVKLLHDIQARDPLAEISEQEKSTVRISASFLLYHILSRSRFRDQIPPSKNKYLMGWNNILFAFFV